MSTNNDIVAASKVAAASDIENVDWSTGTIDGGTHFANMVRFGSSSSQASQSSGDICRICHCESDPLNPLLTPCYCSGSLKFVHQACLQQWLTASETNACELCKFPFIMHTKIKPFNEWRSLDMSGVERRRLCCAVLFHCAAALCVIWSLCVLIERAAEEVKRGLIGWPFWTKLAVVTVGLTGGVVFMYIQCRQYLHLCHRWRARNRILLIQNAPEKMHPLSPPSPLLASRHIPRNNSATAASAMTTNSFNYGAYGYASAGNRSASAVNASNAPQHGQIVANIESNSQNYERDWTLDDVSQISSFRPCPQGSGSMTPFHDSIHNALETSMSRSASNSIGGSRQDLPTATPNSISNSHKTNDLDLFKTSAAPVIGGAAFAAGQSDAASGIIVQAKYPPNSSIFLENRDILNDVGYPKIIYRHSSVLVSPDITDNLDKFLGKDLRRYSDTKLLQNDTMLSPIFNVTNEQRSALQQQKQQRGIQTAPKELLYGDGSHSTDGAAQNLLSTSEIGNALRNTEIIFESATKLDPLEQNIQEILNIDLNKKQQQTDRKKSRHSLNTTIVVESFTDDAASTADELCKNGEAESAVSASTTNSNSVDKSRMFFKSLPNLSGSCESLLKK